MLWWDRLPTTAEESTEKRRHLSRQRGERLSAAQRCVFLWDHSEILCLLDVVMAVVALMQATAISGSFHSLPRQFYIMSKGILIGLLLFFHPNQYVVRAKANVLRTYLGKMGLSGGWLS